nr:hypothetical protein [uncultured Allomuricauda sp.]
MIKRAILIILILMSVKIYSQKCKTDKDPFTNEEITYFDYSYRTVYFEVKNDTILFDVVFNYWGEREHIFKEGTGLSIKLESGAKIDLNTIMESKPKIESSISTSGFYMGLGSGMTSTSSQNSTAYSFVFKLTEPELKKLAESKIEVIRIPDTDEEKYIDLEAKGRTRKKIKAIKKGATCLIQKT